MDLTTPILTLTALFFCVAGIYASVGFGGGSSYLALLALFAVPFAHAPIIGLLCNTIVASGGAWFFARAGYFRGHLLWPFLIGAMPLALLGGLMSVSEGVFYTVLGFTLFAAGARLVVLPKARTDLRQISLSTKVAIGALLGFISGMTGIGGGIFLAPLLMNLGWGRPKEIATASAFFIVANSVVGLVGQFLKAPSTAPILNYWPLFAAVFIGGQIGSRLGSGKFISAVRVLQITGVLVLIVGSKILISRIVD